MASDKEREEIFEPEQFRPEDAAGPDGTGAESSRADDEGPGVSDTVSDNSGVKQYEQRILELEEENAALKDQNLRKQADFENYRRRMMKDKEESAKFANSQLLQDLIPIIDDFERAIRSSEESRSFETFHEGIVLIERQFLSMLERKWGLTRFEAAGQPFDPEKHEAVNAENRPDHDISMVLEDYQKGYILNERVLRPARVKVSLPVQPVAGEDAEAENI